MRPLTLQSLLEQGQDTRSPTERRDARFAAIKTASRIGRSWDKPFQNRVRGAFTRASRRFAQDTGKPTFYSLKSLRVVPTTDPI